jgi:hypothetical protein
LCGLRGLCAGEADEQNQREKQCANTLHGILQRQAV